MKFQWLQNLDRQLQKQLRSRRSGRRQPVRTEAAMIESFEPRMVMAANVMASLSNGTLAIEGTNGNDTIKVQQTNGQISIDGGVRISVAGQLVSSVAASTVSRINLNGRDGNDWLDVSAANVANTNINGGHWQ